MILSEEEIKGRLLSGLSDGSLRLVTSTRKSDGQDVAILCLTCDGTRPSVGEPFQSKTLMRPIAVLTFLPDVADAAQFSAPTVLRLTDEIKERYKSPIGK